jgi:glycosyltransferase involved in cell wall biosynthesis
MSNKPDLTIVIPAYHEERRLGGTLDSLARYLYRDSTLKKLRIEVLVVAADATDKTWQIAETKAALFGDFKLLKPGPRVGKGRDVQYGMIRARGRCVLFMDSDMATPLSHIAEFYHTIQTGANIVVGTRNLRAYRNSRLRGWFSYLGNRIYQLAGGLPVEDTQCGFKMFTAQACQTCFSRQRLMGWGFDMEILAIAQVQELNVKQFRLDDWQHQPHSTYTDKAPRILASMLKDYVIVSFNKQRGLYN